MDLHTKLIQEVLQEAGRKIDTIDRHRGLITETVVIADALNATTPGAPFSPFVCVHDGSVTVDVNARWITPSIVRQAIAHAGLSLEKEEIADGSTYLHPGDMKFVIAGMDVPVVLHSPAEELKAA